jgi:hypothetical protein
MAADRASLVLPSDPSFTVAADAGRQDELPPGVWREVLRQLSVQERFVVSMVCKAWRGHALSLLIPELEVCLNSGALLYFLHTARSAAAAVVVLVAAVVAPHLSQSRSATHTIDPWPFTASSRLGLLNPGSRSDLRMQAEHPYICIAPCTAYERFIVNPG